MDWSLLIIGATLALGSISGLVRPENDVASIDGWKARLEKLRNGASESYFEERRQLEAYPPPKHATSRKVRVISAIGLICGVILIVVGIIR